MKLSGILVLVCVGTCGLFTSLLAPETAGAAFLGMAAPLVAGLATILLVERTVRTNVLALTKRMTVAFITKMVFYPAYVSVAITLLDVDRFPFTVSFTLYFVALHLTEALYFRTLIAQRTSNVAADLRVTPGGPHDRARQGKTIASS